MNDTPNAAPSVAPRDAALQHGGVKRHGPRPLPLFLELVRRVAETDPQLAKEALDGLARYERAERCERAPDGAVVADREGSVLRDLGGVGAPIVLVPSLINPPHILDLDPEVSLAHALHAHGRVLLLDWGDAQRRANCDVGDHIGQRLLPLLDAIGEPVKLVGYCLGGTMALAAAERTAVSRVATLAAPWFFAGYSAEARRSLTGIWDSARAASGALGALPMEVLQSAFWALDPERTVAKFAAFGRLDSESDEARRFVSLEDWSNEGEPLPLPAARELFVDLFGEDRSGAGTWQVGGAAVSGRPPGPMLHLVAANDHIVPAPTTAPGNRTVIPSGHVGMIVGSRRRDLHRALGAFLGS